MRKKNRTVNFVREMKEMFNVNLTETFKNVSRSCFTTKTNRKKPVFMTHFLLSNKTNLIIIIITEVQNKDILFKLYYITCLI